MTKYLPFAAVAALVAATGAAMASGLPLEPVQRADTHLELGTVTSDGPGTVEVYSYRLGQQGALLGSTPVKAGANTNVDVNLTAHPLEPVLVVLTDDTGTQDSTVIRFE